MLKGEKYWLDWCGSKCLKGSFVHNEVDKRGRSILHSQMEIQQHFFYLRYTG